VFSRGTAWGRVYIGTGGDSKDIWGHRQWIIY
jgi:hypothetical protein